MKVNQIKKTLKQNSISLENLEISQGEVSIYVDSGSGCDREATDKLMQQVSKVLSWGGYRCASGEWILQSSRVISSGDWNSVQSPCHY